jgi:transcriptional regulator with XRE-family HTH domain
LCSQHFFGMRNIDRLQVSKRIKEIMKTVGITQKGLADYLDISQPAVSLYLQGRIPPADVLLEIARLSGTTVEWMLTGTREPSMQGLKVEEQRTLYGSEFALFELWKQLPDNIKPTMLKLLQHFANH